MANYYFHYTSLVVAQMVQSSGLLVPGRGVLYLADELFRTAAEAADRLAIPAVGPEFTTGAGVIPLTKPVELVCCIPEQRLDAAVLEGPSSVAPLREPGTRRVIYWGGGRQYKYRASIAIQGLTWVRLVRP